MPEYEWIDEGIFTVADFFSPEECRKHIEEAEAIGFREAPVNTFLGPQIDKKLRNNERVMVDDQALADELWARITDYIPLRLGIWTACGVNERFRFYRYDVGQQFDWHFDGHFERENGERSQLTFMVYLNDDFSGGETTLIGAEVIPRAGSASFFLHKIRHKGQPVTAGRKYVLRTDVMYRRED